ncbi:hypothetical protein D0859_16622 [Hortaea werneckii]|uniref:Uncharacterized protein n=1 Tax=Hortaea werneckii TaxID=91943 RepID=A0A3M7I1H9_HORWE|nr:hypothetical protein D0859_16622 [Hortaea werneckii]
MVNRALAPKEGRPSNEELFTIMGHRKQLSRYAILTKLVLGPALMLDKLRMLLWHKLGLQNAKRIRKGNLAGQTNAAEASSQLWTLTTAFYALSGGLTISHRDSGLAHLTLSPKMIDRLCAQDPECLRHVREPEIIDRSKVSWIAKAIVCGQSLWFCSQCISRVSTDLAITLLELNTFIHCISACCIYLFWWYKPYDVASHTIINSSICEYEARMSFKRRREWFPWLPLEFNVFSRKATIAPRDPENNSHQHFMTHDLIPYEDRDVRTLSQDTFDEMHDNSLKVFVGENIPDTGFSVQSDASTDQHGYILLSPRSLEDWKCLWEQHQRSDGLRQYAEATFDKRLGLLLQKRRQNFNVIAFRPQDMLYSLATFTAYGAVHIGAWNYKFTTTEEGQVWRACAVYTTAFMPALLGIWGVLVLLAQGRIAITAWRKRRRERHPCKTKAWPGSTTPSVSTSKDADSNPCDPSSIYPSEALQDEKPIFPLSHHRLLLSPSFVRNALTHKGILPLCILLAYPLVLAEILSRAFLVVESFIAVPNSPREVYAVVPWSSYLPHLS